MDEDAGTAEPAPEAPGRASDSLAQRWRTGTIGLPTLIVLLLVLGVAGLAAASIGGWGAVAVLVILMIAFIGLVGAWSFAS